MKIKLNDKVLVIAGKDKGKKGKVIRLSAKNEKVVVEKMNMRTKHIKKSSAGAGEKITFEAPMNSSNVMVICPGCSKPTRVAYKMLQNGKKERACKKCKESLDRAILESSAGKAKKKTVKV